MEMNNLDDIATNLLSQLKDNLNGIITYDSCKYELNKTGKKIMFYFDTTTVAELKFELDIVNGLFFIYKNDLPTKVFSNIMTATRKTIKVVNMYTGLNIIKRFCLEKQFKKINQAMSNYKIKLYTSNGISLPSLVETNGNKETVVAVGEYTLSDNNLWLLDKDTINALNYYHDFLMTDYIQLKKDQLFNLKPYDSISLLVKE